MSAASRPPLDTTPYWTIEKPPTFPALSRNLTVDAVVVGGGITGITAAYLLKTAGLTVAVLERGRVGQGETSHTTAHVTAVTDQPYPELVRSFGADHAQAVWDAGFAAIGEIDTIVRRERIDCDFRWVPGFLHTSLRGRSDSDDDARQLRDQAAIVADAGFDAEYLPSIPGFSRPGVRFDGQAKFHPLKYLYAVARVVPGNGCHIFEQSLVDTITADPLSVSAGGHTITARFVVVATHVPIVGKTNMLKATLLQTDLYPYSTYAVGARMPRGLMPEGLFWDLADPYHYLRVDEHDDHSYVVFGGADHKTGQVEDTHSRFAMVEETLLSLLPQAKVTHRWSGQVIETRDGLPYIGETSPKQFAITGFSGNGITFGTLGAMMARDAATGQSNPWRELFDIGRTRIAKGLTDYVSENKDYPYYLIRDRFAGADGKSVRAIPRGQGRILELNGDRVAAYRAEDGTVTLLSPVCTHLGCLVNWNGAEASWDCPCHGSRFTATGKVIGGPAEQPLERAGAKTRARTKDKVDA